jgi:hypothetical protein
VAKALCALLLAPQLLAWTTRPALAQLAIPTVVVIDFNNLSGVGGALLGTRAAAAMALQLRQTDEWDVVSQNDVRTKIEELRLRPPFDKIALQTLARSLDATAVLTGEIRAAQITQNPTQVRVTMVVRLLDVASGELINGAVATGTAQHIGLDGAQDVLLDEALTKAAFDARQRMERYQLPSGTVLNTSVVGTRQDALLNIGSRQGVKQGMQFVVLRGRELVGYLSASSIDADKTTAQITQNFRGVKPEDQVRAIYTLPEDLPPAPQVARTDPNVVVTPDAAPSQRGRRRSLTGAARIFGGLLLALGIYALASRKDGTTSFGTAARAAIVPAASPAESAAIRVTWDRPRQVPPNAVVQYQVYRIDPTNGQQILIATASEAAREVFDTATARQVVDFYTGTGVDPTLEAGPLDVPGIVPGRQYRYNVRTIFFEGVTFEDDTGNGTGTGTTTGLRISQPSAASGQATPLVPPVMTAPQDNTTGVDLTNLTFTWTTVAGANEYSLQVSADPLNPDSYQEVARVPWPSRVGGQSLSRTVNVANRFAGRTLLGARVGARNSTDGRPPVGGYVFSNIAGFSPQ